MVVGGVEMWASTGCTAVGRAGSRLPPAFLAIASVAEGLDVSAAVDAAGLSPFHTFN